MTARILNIAIYLATYQYCNNHSIHVAVLYSCYLIYFIIFTFYYSSLDKSAQVFCIPSTHVSLKTATERAKYVRGYMIFGHLFRFSVFKPWVAEGTPIHTSDCY